VVPVPSLSHCVVGFENRYVPAHSRSACDLLAAYVHWDVQISVLLEVAMSKVRVDEDIRPLSEFRAEVASFVKHIRETRRPMVLTQRGRGVAVLIDVNEFELMQERLEILEDIYRAEEQLAAGGGVPQEEARARVLKGIAR
jgi:prevent-host-death family protein